MPADDRVNVSFPSNSNKDKEEKQKPKKDGERVVKEKVISGEVVQRKKPLGRKVAEAFTGDDARSVGNYILMDVLIPAAKNMIADAVSQGAERMMFGDARPRRTGPVAGPRTSYSSYGRTSYSAKPSGMRALDEGRELSRRARASHDFREIICASRGEAEEVIEGMNTIMDDYGIVTVADLYDLTGITGSFVDNKWGWADLRSVSIQRIREGYLLDVPKPFALD